MGGMREGGEGVLCWISFPDAACTTASSRYLMAGFRLCMRTGSRPLPVTPPPCLVVLNLMWQDQSLSWKSPKNNYVGGASCL